MSKLCIVLCKYFVNNFKQLVLKNYPQMLIADTFKIDRLYTREFRKLLAVSFHKRSSQSIQNILMAPVLSPGFTSQLRRQRDISYSRQLEHVSLNRNSFLPSPSNRRQFQSYETPKHQQNVVTEEELKQDEKVLSFLDSNLERIHKTKKDVSLRKRLKFNSRCSTETNVSLAKIQPFQLEQNLHVSKKSCSNAKQPPKQIPHKINSRKLRYMRLPKPSKEDKQNKYLEFCPWDCRDPYQE